MMEPTVEYTPIATPVNGTRPETAWVELGAIARRHLAEALLSAPPVRALLAAAAEAGGPTFPDGTALTVELEITATRVRLVPGP